MRRYGLPEPYEQLKALTRGQGITRDSLRAFIAELPLPASIPADSVSAPPATYVGLAERLAREI
jgi:adenylosuccinate lyase